MVSSSEGEKKKQEPIKDWFKKVREEEAPLPKILLNLTETV